MSGLFTQLKGQLALNRLSEDRLIEIVLEEQKQGEVDEVALAKARMDAEGDEKKAEALYIKHRIRRIKDSDNANTALAESIVQKAKAWEQKNDQEIKSTKEGDGFPMVILISILLILFMALITVASSLRLKYQIDGSFL